MSPTSYQAAPPRGDVDGSCSGGVTTRQASIGPLTPGAEAPGAPDSVTVEAPTVRPLRRPHDAPNPRSLANTIAWARDQTPSLSNRFETWFRTVFSLRSSRAAISPFPSPSVS